MKYKIYFEIYGKKMVAVIEANSEEDAEYLLRGKIKINKIVEVKNEIYNEVEDFKNIFNIK